MKIGILGCGAIAETLVDFKLKNRLNVDLSYFYDLDSDVSKDLANKVDANVVTSVEELAIKSDLVLECASQGAVKSSIPVIINNSTDVVIMSVGALMDKEFKEHLESLAVKNNSKIYLPTGAITGIDTVNAATLGEIESVTLITRKPPISLGLDTIDDTQEILFEGKASEAVQKFPKNINVSSTLSLASGIDANVKIIADSSIENNTHEIHIKGSFGELITKTSNVSSPNNPKTSLLAAYSAASLLNKLSKTIQIGS